MSTAKAPAAPSSRICEKRVFNYSEEITKETIIIAAFIIKINILVIFTLFVYSYHSLSV